MMNTQSDSLTDRVLSKINEFLKLEYASGILLVTSSETRSVCSV